MRRRASSLLLLAALVLPRALVHAQQRGETQTGGAAFLLVPVGARAAGLGQAAVADEGGSESAFWNPAGLAAMDRSAISIHRGNTFASNNTVLSGYVVSQSLGTVGVAAYLVDFGSQEVVAGAGQAPTGRITPRNVELLASYGTDVAGPFTLGLSYKLIQFRQDCSGDCTPFRTIVGTTHAVDVGVQYGVGHGGPFQVGVAVLHAGFKLQVQNREQADPLPTRMQVGAAYRVHLPAPQEAGERLDARLLVDLQDAWGSYDNPDARFGLELAYGSVLRVRTGYAFLHAESSGPSVGIGLRFGRISVDFARIFFESSTLENPVYLSLSAGL